MSFGMTPQDFVQQVYYVQEKVLLDFLPKDDKYREVITEANLVLQELQNSEDWIWLRTQIDLGDLRDYPGRIPEIELPDWVYKLSTLRGDGIHIDHPHGRRTTVPIVPPGQMYQNYTEQSGPTNAINVHETPLLASHIGNILTFNRPLFPHEWGYHATVDVQRRLEPLHVCDLNCSDKCEHIEELVFQEIPDPNYMVVRTAALHAQGSPPAQGRLLDLTDQAQKILSAMRENNYAATAPGFIEHDAPTFISVI